MFLDLGGVFYLDKESCSKVRDLDELTNHLNKLISRIPIEHCKVKINCNTNKTTLTLSVTSDSKTSSIYDKYQLLNVFGLLSSYGFKFLKIDDETLNTYIVKNPVDYVGHYLNLF